MENKLFDLPFSAASQKDWLDKVVSDMKGKKSWEDFMVNIDGITINPFSTTSHNLPPLDRYFDHILPGAALKITDGKSGNKSVLALLNKGAESLCLEILDSVSPEELCENIHLDYLFSLFLITDKTTADNFSEFIEKTYVEKGVKAFIICQGEVVYPKQTLFLSIDISTHSIEPLKEALLYAEDQILHNKPLRCITRFSLGKNFLLTIATLRSFRILWENLLVKTGFEEDIPLIVSTVPKEQILSADPNQALIETSYCLLSAVLGNTDISFSAVLPGNDELYNKRAFLIHQIFKEEGKLYSVKDPAAGSYFLEETTQKIAEKVWDKL